jgi:hypothetical protein
MCLGYADNAAKRCCLLRSASPVCAIIQGGCKREKMQSETSSLIACVGDFDARFEDQALRLVATALAFGRISPADIAVGWVGTAPARIRALENLGIKTLPVPSSDTLPRHCNKLKLVEEIIGRGLLNDRSHLLLLDCDIAFVAPVDARVLHGSQVSGRIAGYPNPPMDIWNEILRESGLATAGTVRTAFDATNLTPYENLNGGVLSFPTSTLTNLLHRWMYWADWAIEHPGLLGKWSFFTDQISLALCLMELRSMPRHLPLEYNLAWGTPRHLFAQLRSLVLLHYHEHASGGRLAEAGLDRLDETIKQINGLGGIDEALLLPPSRVR